MRRQTDTNWSLTIIIENLWIWGQSPPFTQTIFRSWGIYKVTLVTQAVWSGSSWAAHVQVKWHGQHVRMAKTKISLRIRYIPRFKTFLWLFLFAWNLNLRKVWPNKTLARLRIIAISMVHLFIKFLASLERCMCEKEVIRTAYASLIDRCGGAPGAQQV